MKYIVFGKAACSACQELRKQLFKHAIGHTYYSLDPPKGELNIDDLRSIAEWAAARTAMAAEREYRVLATTQLPAVFRVKNDVLVHPDMKEHLSRCEQIRVLDEHGNVDIGSLL